MQYETNMNTGEPRPRPEVNDMFQHKLLGTRFVLLKIKLVDLVALYTLRELSSYEEITIGRSALLRDFEFIEERIPV